MSRTLHKLFPLIDHLYIFQNLEYEWLDFLKWFIKHPFKRNLQRKHKIEWTPKARLLVLTSLILMIVEILKGSIIISGSAWFIPPVILVVGFFSPVYLIVAQGIIFPLEYYQKQKTLFAAKKRLDQLPNLKVIAIVGSYAKTSIKNMIYILLWKDYRVVKTPKSFNTPISIARTILSDIKNNTEIFLVEMDAYHSGDIKALCNLVNPDLGIITAIGAQHLGRFGSMGKLAKAQFELAESLPKDGLLFLNTEDNETSKISPNYSNNKIFFGAGGDFYPTGIKLTKDGTEFILHTKKGEKVNIILPLLGEHNVINFLAATAITKSLGMRLRVIAKRTKKILPTPHRLEVKHQGDITIIDNTYNTNPTSSRFSLKLLSDIPGSQKILITPGLVELGKEHSKENQEFAKAAGKVADQIIIVGQNTKKDLIRGLEAVHFPKHKTHLVTSTAEGITLLQTLAKPYTVILLENDLPDQYF